MLKQDYASPRVSGEICDCSMPITFDTYSTCSFNCIYCFAYYQKSHVTSGYKDNLNHKNREVRSVNPEKVKKIFLEALNDNCSCKQSQQFKNYIQNKITMQWGGGWQTDSMKMKKNTGLVWNY